MSYPILLVDDNPDACATTAKMLWTCGYQVDVAYDPQAALNLIDKTPYALAIVDFQMAPMNGVELFKRSAPSAPTSREFSSPVLPVPKSITRRTKRASRSFFPSPSSSTN